MGKSMLTLYLIKPLNFLGLRKVDLWKNKICVRSGSVKYLSNPNNRKACIVVTETNCVRNDSIFNHANLKNAYKRPIYEHIISRTRNTYQTGQSNLLIHFSPMSEFGHHSLETMDIERHSNGHAGLTKVSLRHQNCGL